ncbi:hypothetical protein FIBSPDRAFT_958333 [Athelia psychrophila]|uniref:Biotin carboxylation domain-containing protein n=1 Tax=Athelia psychrophila TaxID=1759441 RepID=A0A166EQ03_9AGAM|nr:hypothetical protein FIBSPDRAFT_958333 [Fibularhizoctonia sp. CBS 109695]
MIRALGGGGGRGIRAVSAQEGVEEALKRFVVLFRYHFTHVLIGFMSDARARPSQTSFLHRRHFAAQVANGTGDVVQVWGRERSVQRRLQKLVETAPSTITRNLVHLLLTAATRMTRALRYQGADSFACLANSHTGEWVFLKINPYMQVEHGISIARPAGRGVRVDTWLYRAGVRGCNIGTDCDSLLAKILARGRDLGEATQQAVRALRETSVKNEDGGVDTDRTVLVGAVAHVHWEEGK